jgi:hypothetical protein
MSPFQLGRALELKTELANYYLELKYRDHVP